MIGLRFIPLVLKQLWRHGARSLLTIAGVAIAMFLFTGVQAMQHGVTVATQETANDTTLVVYRKDRFCPATSLLPQDYMRRIERLGPVCLLCFVTWEAGIARLHSCHQNA